MRDIKNTDQTQLKSTLLDIERALAQWDEAPEMEENPQVSEFRKKTRELLEKLQNQIKELGL